jgi:hypothetical protein
VKAKPPPGEPTLPAHLAGSVVLRVTAHGLVYAKAPEKRGAATSGYPFYQQQEFALVQRLIKFVDPLAWQTAKAWSEGTSQLPRDVLAMQMYGTWITIETEDGEIFESARMSNPNPQYILDGVTSEVGSILYRAEIGWVGLPPGLPGNVLAIGDDAFPYWANASNGGAAPYVLVGAWDSTTDPNTTTVESDDLSPYSEVSMMVLNVTLNSAQRRVWEYSVDGGANWLGSSNARTVNSAGIPGTISTFDFHNIGTTNARDGFGRLFQINANGQEKLFQLPNIGSWGFIGGDLSPINKVRVSATSGATLTGGKVRIFAR